MNLGDVIATVGLLCLAGALVALLARPKSGASFTMRYPQARSYAIIGCLLVYVGSVVIEDCIGEHRSGLWQQTARAGSDDRDREKVVLPALASDWVHATRPVSIEEFQKNFAGRLGELGVGDPRVIFDVEPGVSMDTFSGRVNGNILLLGSADTSGGAVREMLIMVPGADAARMLAAIPVIVCASRATGLGLVSDTDDRTISEIVYQVTQGNHTSGPAVRKDGQLEYAASFSPDLGLLFGIIVQR
ncbi:hypothetical protein RN01_06975 [Cupriavidus sp. SHE]|jgi:hypothetical protein|nr:hypothetical protein RN01_06975 [Cupriavidus sp. SHE]